MSYRYFAWLPDFRVAGHLKTARHANGYFEPNTYNAYTVQLDGATNAGGLVTTQFGSCDGKIADCLPIMDGWNYTVRLPALRKTPRRHIEVFRKRGLRAKVLDVR